MGVRRPLRFLAHKLDLSDAQVSTVAEIIDDVRTERAQAEVDDRRARKALAAAISGDAFDKEVAQAAAEQRVTAAREVQATLVAAFEKLHALLEPAQRDELVLLIRAGALSF